MRSMKIALAFALLGGVFYVLDRATKPPDPPKTGPNGSEIAEIVADRTGLRLTGLVATSKADGGQDFRGLLDENGRMLPVFGILTEDCAASSGTTTCTTVADLLIAGEASNDLIAALPSPLDTAEDIDAEIETADIRRDTDVPEHTIVHRAVGDHGSRHDMLARALHRAKGPPIPTPRPQFAMTDTALPPTTPGDGLDAPREPTHTVGPKLINARTGPGRETEVVAQLAEGLRLAKTGEQDGWGRFIVLDGADAGREIWASLAIVKPVE